MIEEVAQGLANKQTAQESGMTALYVQHGHSLAVAVSGRKVLKRGKGPNEWTVIEKGWEWQYKTGALYVRFKKGPWLKVRTQVYRESKASEQS
jgi:hypothetical protein